MTCSRWARTDFHPDASGLTMRHRSTASTVFVPEQVS